MNSYSRSPLPRLEVGDLVVDLVDDLVVGLHGEEVDLEVGRALDVGQDERVDVERAGVAVDGDGVALLAAGAGDRGVVVVVLLFLLPVAGVGIGIPAPAAAAVVACHCEVGRRFQSCTVRSTFTCRNDLNFLSVFEITRIFPSFLLFF